MCRLMFAFSRMSKTFIYNFCLLLGNDSSSSSHHLSIHLNGCVCSSMEHGNIRTTPSGRNADQLFAVGWPPEPLPVYARSDRIHTYTRAGQALPETICAHRQHAYEFPVRSVAPAAAARATSLEPRFY